MIKSLLALIRPKVVEKGCSPLDPHSFVNVALDLGYITKEDIHKAVCVQTRYPPIGTIMRDEGILTPVQCDEVNLECQKRVGKKIDLDLARKVERARMHSTINKVREVFKEGADSSRGVVDSIVKLASE